MTYRWLGSLALCFHAARAQRGEVRTRGSRSAPMMDTVASKPSNRHSRWHKQAGTHGLVSGASGPVKASAGSCMRPRHGRSLDSAGPAEDERDTCSTSRQRRVRGERSTSTSGAVAWPVSRSPPPGSSHHPGPRAWSAQAFEAALSASQPALQGETLWYRSGRDPLRAMSGCVAAQLVGGAR